MTAAQIQKFSKLSTAKLKAKAQTVFNKWIRIRDSGLPCISCGTGQVAQAGHYLSQGHHSALRFDELNTNGQCIRCNLFLHGNLIGYRKGLVRKIGEAAVVGLECTRKKAHRWDRFTLIDIILKYSPILNGKPP